MAAYDDKKIDKLINNEKIIRNRLKVQASVNNAKVFKSIQNEYGTFRKYLEEFTGQKIYYEIDKITSSLSDRISLNLKKRGMKFVGSTIIYSYLQAIGVINSHESGCYLNSENKQI